MMTYFYTKLFVFLFIGLYFFSSLWIVYSPWKSQNDNPDTLNITFFPLYSWTIFTDVPRTIESYPTLRISYVNGVAIEPPIYFVDADKLFDTSKKPKDSWYKLFEQLSRDIQSGDNAHILATRKEIEAGFLSANVTYELVQIRFQPIEFFRTRKVLNSISYGIFKTSEGHN